jgi:hypothetical protein
LLAAHTEPSRSTRPPSLIIYYIKISQTQIHNRAWLLQTCMYAPACLLTHTQSKSCIIKLHINLKNKYIVLAFSSFSSALAATVIQSACVLCICVFWFQFQCRKKKKSHWEEKGERSSQRNISITLIHCIALQAAYIININLKQLLIL